MRKERLGLLKICKDPTGNQTRGPRVLWRSATARPLILLFPQRVSGSQPATVWWDGGKTARTRSKPLAPMQCRVRERGAPYLISPISEACSRLVAGIAGSNLVECMHVVRCVPPCVAPLWVCVCVCVCVVCC